MFKRMLISVALLTLLFSNSVNAYLRYTAGELYDAISSHDTNYEQYRGYIVGVMDDLIAEGVIGVADGYSYSSAINVFMNYVGNNPTKRDYLAIRIIRAAFIKAYGKH